MDRYRDCLDYSDESNQSEPLRFSEEIDRFSSEKDNHVKHLGFDAFTKAKHEDDDDRIIMIQT